MMPFLIVFVFLIPVIALPILACLKQLKFLHLFFCTLYLINAFLLLSIQDDSFIYNLGNWPTLFAINLNINAIAVLMLSAFALVGTLISLFIHQNASIINKQLFYSGYWLLYLAIPAILFNADLFNLYVWFEVSLISAFIIICSQTKCHIANLKIYGLMQIIGALFMLAGIASIYGVSGALSLQGIQNYLNAHNMANIYPGLCLVMFGLFIKSAIIPLHFWLPRVYIDTNAPARMLLSTISTKISLFTILKLTVSLNLYQSKSFLFLIMILALLTMFLGVFAATAQTVIRKILTFHIVSQLGYMLLALTLPPSQAIVSCVVFMIHNIFTKTGLFMLDSSIVEDNKNLKIYFIENYVKHNKFLMISFILLALSLAGFPPLSGFWAKFILIKNTMASGYYTATLIAIFVSLFTMYSMLKIWRYVFCEKQKTNPSQCHHQFSINKMQKAAIILIIAIPLYFSLHPDDILNQISSKDFINRGMI